MRKSEFVAIKKLVERFENLDNCTVDTKENIKSELEKSMSIIDDMSCTNDWMTIALKARQIVKYNRIYLKPPG